MISVEPSGGKAAEQPQQRKTFRELDLERQQSFRVRPMGTGATSSGKAAERPREQPQQRVVKSYDELERERKLREAERKKERGRVVKRTQGAVVLLGDGDLARQQPRRLWRGGPGRFRQRHVGQIRGGHLSEKRRDGGQRR